MKYYKIPVVRKRKKDGYYMFECVETGELYAIDSMIWDGLPSFFTTSRHFIFFGWGGRIDGILHAKTTDKLHKLKLIIENNRTYTRNGAKLVALDLEYFPHSKLIQGMTKKYTIYVDELRQVHELRYTANFRGFSLP